MSQQAAVRSHWLAHLLLRLAIAGPLPYLLGVAPSGIAWGVVHALVVVAVLTPLFNQVLNVWGSIRRRHHSNPRSADAWNLLRMKLVGATVHNARSDCVQRVAFLMPLALVGFAIGWHVPATILATSAVLYCVATWIHVRVSPSVLILAASSEGAWILKANLHMVLPHRRSVSLLAPIGDEYGHRPVTPGEKQVADWNPVLSRDMFRLRHDDRVGQDNQWQSVVAELMNLVDVILIVDASQDQDPKPEVGHEPPLHWEMTHILEFGLMAKAWWYLQPNQDLPAWTEAVLAARGLSLENLHVCSNERLQAALDFSLAHARRRGFSIGERVVSHLLAVPVESLHPPGFDPFQSTAGSSTVKKSS